MYSVRFNPEEVARIELSAQRAEVPASTVVRGWVLHALAELEVDASAGAVARIEAPCGDCGN